MQKPKVKVGMWTRWPPDINLPILLIPSFSGPARGGEGVRRSVGNHWHVYRKWCWKLAPGGLLQEAHGDWYLLWFNTL